MERIREVSVRIVVDTNKRTIEQELELGEDESAQSFGERVQDAVSRVVRSASE